MYSRLYREVLNKYGWWVQQRVVMMHCGAFTSLMLDRPRVRRLKSRAVVDAHQRCLSALHPVDRSLVVAPCVCVSSVSLRCLLASPWRTGTAAPLHERTRWQCISAATAPPRHLESPSRVRFGAAVVRCCRWCTCCVRLCDGD